MSSLRFSIVVPVFDAERFIGALLDSFPCPLPAGFELIVVDDCSRDHTLGSIDRHPLRPWIRFFQTPVNSGPAAARNLGASHAAAPLLLFFDADVVLLPDTLERVERYVAEHPDVRCASGIDAPVSATPGWVPEFHALFAHHALGLMADGAVASAWNPRNGLVERALFHELGGFDASYRRADVEDYALSRAISARTPIRFTRALEVVHRFGGLRATSAAFFRRSAMWVQLAWRTGQADTTGHTRVSHLPSVAVSAAIVGCAALWPWLPLTRAIVALVALQVLLDASLLRFFVSRAGLVRGLSFLVLLIHFQAVAALGAALGAGRIAFDAVRGSRPASPRPAAVELEA